MKRSKSLAMQRIGTRVGKLLGELRFRDGVGPELIQHRREVLMRVIREELEKAFIRGRGM